jgi:ArsR family transcriptional regulator
MSLDRARKRIAGQSADSTMQRLRKVLRDPARLRILEALAATELCVNDLALAIDRAPAATSQHLRVLRDLALVEGHRRGTAMYYRLTPGATKRLAGVLRSIAAA